MAHDVCELLWIKRIVQDLKLSHLKPKLLHYDNKAAILIANKPVQHDRTKYVEVDRHFIKDHLNQRIIDLSFVSSQTQFIDILTKAVSRKMFHNSLSKLEMIDIHSPT